MTYNADYPTLPVRQEVLLEGIDFTPALETVHDYVSYQNKGENVAVIQHKTLELIRELVSEGLYEIGDELPVNHGRFIAWDVPVDDAIERIREVYVGQFDDLFQWWYICRLRLTDEGRRVAEALGCPPEQVVYDNSDCTLRDLRATLGDTSYLDPLVTEVLTTPECPGLIAVRSTGSFVLFQRWMHARYYTYIACSPEPGGSRLLQQVLISDSTLEEPLAADLTALTDTARQAFIAATNAP